MKETSESISQWAHATFGPVTTFRSAVRANTEMAELLTKIAKFNGDFSVEACEAVGMEIADVVICLSRLSHMFHRDLFVDVDKKMAVNRKREWLIDGSGCGQHVERT